jgi:hypothetical protein
MTEQALRRPSQRRVALLLAAAALLLFAIPVQAARADRSTTMLFDMMTGDPVAGSVSSIVRTDTGVSITVGTSGLMPGHTYTIWWVIFNDPSLCFDGPADGSFACGMGDLLLMGGAAEGTLAYASGNVVGRSGKGNFGASLQDGDTSGVIDGGDGLTNPRGAEIHLVVRDHGPKNPEWMPDQIHTFGGGCDQNDPGYPPPLVGEGVAGDFACFDPQFTVHVAH